jgi:ABC-2 type transport system ATP-binding protein
MPSTIEIRELRKHYGATLAVDDLSFTVQPGQVTGFVGPNGAGKSTTMRMILGLDAPDGGSALIDGKRYQTLSTPLCHVGALLDASAIHPGRRARDHLLWLAHYNGLSRRRVDEVLEQVGLASVARRRAGGFSLGMRQRLGIAGALLGDPPVLLFDEPVNGLDPEGVLWIRTLLRSFAAEGRTVFLSSHLMSEMAITADRLVIIGRGRLIAETTVADLLRGSSGGFVRVRSPQGEELAGLLRARGVAVVCQGDGALHVTGISSDEVGELARANGLTLLELSVQQASLEQTYMELTRDAVDYREAEGTPAPALN